MSIGKKIAAGLIVAVNIAGIICLIYLAVLYIQHDTTVAVPDAMIPFERWEAAGSLLTIGCTPLAIANLLAFLYVGGTKIGKKVKILFFAPSFICMLFVIHYWIFSLMADALQT